ncbi:hypothetical protein ACHAWF_006845, partial [Thalassiosira exigua]
MGKLPRVMADEGADEKEKEDGNVGAPRGRSAVASQASDSNEESSATTQDVNNTMGEDGNNSNRAAAATTEAYARYYVSLQQDDEEEEGSQPAKTSVNGTKSTANDDEKKGSGDDEAELDPLSKTKAQPLDDYGKIVVEAAEAGLLEKMESAGLAAEGGKYAEPPESLG